MSWLEKLLPPKIKQTNPDKRKSVPEGLWMKCSGCEVVLYKTDLAINLYVCPKCNHHLRISARERLDNLLDIDGRFEIAAEVVSADPLKFKDTKRYPERLTSAMHISGETEALIVQGGAIRSLAVIVACFEFNFMAGSMGSAAGERFVQGILVALEQKVPFICITASGGARMQESLFSLLQMAKTTAMIAKLSSACLPFISVLTDPTMGGVSASFAFLGDIVIAEPKALIGFAGPRVIEQTVRETLPAEFQRAEFLLRKGAIDMIIDRRYLKDKIAHILALLQNQPADILSN